MSEGRSYFVGCVLFRMYNLGMAVVTVAGLRFWNSIVVRRFISIKDDVSSRNMEART